MDEIIHAAHGDVGIVADPGHLNQKSRENNDEQDDHRARAQRLQHEESISR
jgi:hypothetical protein